MSTKSPTLVATSRPRKKLQPEDVTPVTQYVTLIDCVYPEDDKPVTEKFELIEIKDGIATLWNPDIGKIQAPIEKVKNEEVIAGMRIDDL